MELSGSDLHALIFVPTLGITRTLPLVLLQLPWPDGARTVNQRGTSHWVIEQGLEMGRPSLLEIETDKDGGKITSIRIFIRVGRASVLVCSGEMEIPTFSG